MNFIIGKYGSGKTALINSILNEMDRVDDKVLNSNNEVSIIE
jgi:hypothetical protein